MGGDGARSTARSSDSRSGFCNQCVGNPGVRCSCNCSGSDASMSDFSMQAAMNLYREIFGEDIKDTLAKLGSVAGQLSGHAACVAGQAVGAAGGFAGLVAGSVGHAATETAT